MPFQISPCVSFLICLSPLYPSFDSLFSREVNCRFSSLTRRLISSPAVLSALSGEIHAWAVVSVCLCASCCRDALLQLSSGLRCVSETHLDVKLRPRNAVLLSFPWALSGCVRGGWLVVGGRRAGGTPQGMALHVCNNLGVRLVLPAIDYCSSV